MSHVMLLRLAEIASKHFQTDIALGNFIDFPEDSADQFLVVTPDAKFYRAYATENGEVFDVERCSPATSLEDAIFDLEEGKESEQDHF